MDEEWEVGLNQTPLADKYLFADWAILYSGSVAKAAKMDTAALLALLELAPLLVRRFFFVSS